MTGLLLSADLAGAADILFILQFLGPGIRETRWGARFRGGRAFLPTPPGHHKLQTRGIAKSQSLPRVHSFDFTILWHFMKIEGSCTFHNITALAPPADISGTRCRF